MKPMLERAEVLDVSVAVPTVGRPDELRLALASLSVCRPGPAEVIVVDQSTDDAVASVVAEFAAQGVTRLPSAGRGIALAMNEALRHARQGVVLVTHDDCSVAPEWVDVGARLARSAPGCLFTGRVLPDGDPELVPSTKSDPMAYDFAGEVRCDVLYPANMVVPRLEALALGGFDERFETAAEDNDFCYRWLRSGKSLRYEPSLVVWHRDWRTPGQLRKLYVRYWVGHGYFYAKHLRTRDLGVLRFLPADVRYALAMLRVLASRTIRGRRPILPAEYRGLCLGFVPGLVAGWRRFK